MSATDGVPAPAALAFACLPATYMDLSWWRDDWLPQALFERLRGEPRSAGWLSRFVVRTLELGDVGPVVAESPEARLLCLGARRLERLVVLAGVTLLSGRIAQILRGTDRRLVKAALGEDDYAFALRRGRLLLHQARLAPTSADLGETDLADTAEACWRLGIGGLAAALQGTTAGFTRRIQLMLNMESVARHWTPLAGEPARFQRLFGLLDGQVAVP
ncbi:MAG: SctK family type III secretion system sorting platform protein [Gammaproteobacteria bacterium]|nr:SctK family type III secretion system sorting platform protein [Gammaproteobacteria bacterium]